MNDININLEKLSRKVDETFKEIEDLGIKQENDKKEIIGILSKKIPLDYAKGVESKITYIKRAYIILSSILLLVMCANLIFADSLNEDKFFFSCLGLFAFISLLFASAFRYLLGLQKKVEDRDELSNFINSIIERKDIDKVDREKLVRDFAEFLQSDNLE